ncbi:MAG: hypothetical protein HKM93_13435 [Desulfobacteraceae bacterium]|nr:hypothetical protein [Desulfobacteraceae bacterium]
MKNIDQLSRQVLANCEISDAQHAGLYSICGLALRLRDLYKWEHGLAPWEESDATLVLDWIGQKEELWERIATDEYKALRLNGATFDPFDTVNINKILLPHGLFYGAGLAYHLKPCFLLADIEAVETVEGKKIFVLGGELARDLLTLPALTQDDAILLRTHASRMHLWDQMIYLKKSGRGALRFALDAAGIPSDEPSVLRHALPRIWGHQRDTYIYHEIGELHHDGFHRQVWSKIIADFPQGVVGLLARAVKDILADTCPQGTLHRMVETRNVVGLGLYVAFIDGLRATLLTELKPAFNAFRVHGDWSIIHGMINNNYKKTMATASSIEGIYTAGKQKHTLDWIDRTIRSEYLPR